jgi:nicotinamidase-related amidase
MGEDHLQFGPLGPHCLHLCVDMQRLFAEGTDWHTPWMPRVLPVVQRLVAARPERTIFTRFVPAERPGEGRGTWRRYYERWPSMTLSRLGRDMVELVPELARYVPPAEVLDKRAYSPWTDTDLEARLRRRHVDTLVISGAETEVCVLATVLGAVDRGYRVVLAADALCSSADSTHEALLTVYRQRYGQQIELASVDEILRDWPG